MPLTVSHVADCPDLGPECFHAGHAPTPYNHHVDEVLAETVLDASLGVTDWFGIEARWSLRVADVNPTYSELDGTPKEVPDDIHHHDETLVDLTDPWLMMRFASVFGSVVGVLRLGASFPVGRTEPDPYALGREGKRHQHLQAGTGTLVPIAGLGLSVAIGRDTVVPITLGVSATGFFNATENGEGFRAPVRLYGSHRVTASFMKGVLNPFADVTLAHEGEELWNGEVGLEGSNVRTEVYLGGGLEWRFHDRWSVALTTRARVATLTEAPSFESRGLFSLALSGSFDLWGSAPSDAPEKIEQRVDDGVVEFEKK